jgi:hypothetical protein
VRDDSRDQRLSASRPPGDRDGGTAEPLIEHVLAALQQAAEPGFGMTLEIVRGVDDAEGNVLRREHDKTPNARVVPIKNTKKSDESEACAWESSIAVDEKRR